MQYESLDFLEYFDNEIVRDKEAGYIDYEVSKKDMKLSISMNTYEDWVYFILVNKDNEELIDFTLSDVSLITCEKNNPKAGSIRFVFFQKDKQFPIVIVYLKPCISFSLDIDQENHIY